MGFVTNSINFPEWNAKSTPTTSDILMLSDQAASGALKQSPVSGFPALNAQQVTQYSTSGLGEFSCSIRV